MPDDALQALATHLSSIDTAALADASQAIADALKRVDTSPRLSLTPCDDRADDTTLLRLAMVAARNAASTASAFASSGGSPLAAIDIDGCRHLSKCAVTTSCLANPALRELHLTRIGRASWTPEQLLRVTRCLEQLQVLNADVRANGASFALLRLISHPAVRLRKLVLHRAGLRGSDDVPLDELATALKRKAEWLHDVDASSGGVADAFEFVTRLLSGEDCQVRNVALSGAGPQPLAALEKLAASLAANSRLESLALGNNFISGAGCSALAGAVGTHPSLRTLELEHNPILDAGATALYDSLNAASPVRAVALSFVGAGNLACAALQRAIHRGVQLHTVDLGGNLISAEGAATLARCITAPASPLRVLNLSANSRLRADGALELAAALASPACRLEELSLAGCAIGAAPCGRIGVALSRSPSLATLDLSRNQLGDMGAWDLAWALAETSTRLSTLLLRSNDIEDDGATELCAVVGQNTTITCLDLTGNRISCELFDSLDPRVRMDFQARMLM